jgi:hypothetical protein
MRPMACVAIVSLSLIGCRHAPTQPNTSTFSLTSEDVSCTDVILQLTLGAGTISPQVTLKRDTMLLFTKAISGIETIFADTGLLPNHTYTYTAIAGDEVRRCTATTLDTTSHTWSWQTYALGGASSSALFDCVILNDSLVIAVGQIFVYGDQIPYCVAIWEGKNWQLKRLYVYEDNQGLSVIGIPIQGVYAFSATDVWLAPGSIFHWNGRDSIVDFSFNRLTLPDPNETVIKLWGSSRQDIFGVGSVGTVVHFNGTSWAQIECGTTLDVVDIYGSTSLLTGRQEILAVASKLGASLDRKILQINGSTVTTLSDYPITQPLSGIWFVPGRHYYVTGSGTYEKRKLTDSVWTLRPASLTPYYTDEVRGNGLNDVMVVGAFGEVLHFNGQTWQSYRSQTALSNGAYGGLAVRGNLAIAVGHDGPQAVISVGRR